MPSDDLSSRDPEAYSTSAGGNSADELADTTERLERGSWDPFEDTPMPPGPANEAPVEHAPIRTFLERQLQERPLPTLIAAVAVGWLVGKLLR